MSAPSHPASAISVQCASKPCSLRALARACRASRLLICLVLELVVSFEPMRCDEGVAGLDVRRQVEGYGRGLLALLAMVIECQAHRIGVRHAALQRLTDCGLEIGGAVAVEQAQQGRGDGAEIVA